MYNKTHIRLVYTHSKGVGRDNYAQFVALPVILLKSSKLAAHSGMIEICINALNLKKISYLLTLFPLPHIYDARSRDAPAYS